ncbi:hypothetical protein AX15_007853 [Amanita polypyramis BW_CC]|nr:hypothetical protein AX15_007853 [Amanita polypyramis BW_CC]
MASSYGIALKAKESLHSFTPLKKYTWQQQAIASLDPMKVTLNKLYSKSGICTALLHPKLELAQVWDSPPLTYGPSSGHLHISSGTILCETPH